MEENIQKKMEEAIGKISKNHAETLDIFVAAILKVREEVGEEIDMNYIALEYGNSMSEDGILKSTVKVVYTKG